MSEREPLSLGQRAESFVKAFSKINGIVETKGRDLRTAPSFIDGKAGLEYLAGATSLGEFRQQVVERLTHKTLPFLEAKRRELIPQLVGRLRELTHNGFITQQELERAIQESEGIGGVQIPHATEKEAISEVQIFVAPIAYDRGRDEKVEMRIPREKLDAISTLPDGQQVMFSGRSGQNKIRIINILTSLPEGMGVLRSSLAVAVFGNDISLARALYRLSTDLAGLRSVLEKKHWEVANPVTHSGRKLGVEARYYFEQIAKAEVTRESSEGLVPVSLPMEGINEGAIQAEPLSGKEFRKKKIGPELPDSKSQAATIELEPAKGDSEAFSELYKRHQSTIYRYILYKVGDGVVAEDLTSEVFIKAWGGFGSYEPRGLPFQHWLITIARNTVFDHWRANRRPTDPIEALEDTRSKEPSLEEHAALGAEMERMRQALVQLPGDQRDVLTLRLIEGYSHAETAVVLGKSEVAIRQIKVRGMRALRGILNNQGITY